jgi:hypothetical protein
MDNAEWDEQLRSACRGLGCRSASHVAFTSKVRLGGTPAAATLALSAEGVCANMQELGSAFEAWCLVLYGLLEVERVNLSWEFPERREHEDYRRFLYRVRRFKELFGERLGVELRCAHELETFMPTGDYVLNLKGGDRTRLGDPSAPLPERALENDLETFIVSSPEVTARLKQLCGLVTLDNQLPVGVFRDGEVSTANRFLNAGRIDLWGLTERDRVALFELKKEANESVGALAQLLFYAMLLRDAQRPDEGEPLLRFSEDARTTGEAFRKIPGTRGVDAYLLAPRFHALIECDGARVVRVLQTQLQQAGLQVDFGLIRQDAEHRFERLV